MGFVAYVHNGKGIVYNVAVCDHCGKLIRNARQGVFVYRNIETKGIVDAFMPIITLHHNISPDGHRCHNAYERLHAKAGDLFGWGYLSEFIAHLGNNMQMDWDNAELLRPPEVIDYETDWEKALP